MDQCKYLNLKKYKYFHFISGSRFLRYKDRKNNPIQRIIMIWLLSKFISFLYSRKITDATCGFRMFKVSLLSNDLSFFNISCDFTLTDTSIIRFENYFKKILNDGAISQDEYDLIKQIIVKLNSNRLVANNLMMDEDGKINAIK